MDSRERMAANGRKGSSVSDKIDIHDEVAALCAKFGIDPSMVTRIELQPTRAALTVYLPDANGRKHVDQDGEPAVEVRGFTVTT